MQQIKGLFKLARPLTTLTGALAVFLGGWVAGTGEWFNVLLAAISVVLVSSSANAWNDYLDIEIDRINQPNRPLPSGQVNLRTAKIFSFVTAGLALLLAATINLPSFLIALASVVILYVYSWRLKSTVLMGNATIALISGLSAVYGAVAAGNASPSVWLFGIIWVAIFGREILKTLADYEGDLRQRCRTISTVWGRRPARVVFYIMAATTMIMMMVPYLQRVYSPVYAWIVVLGVYPVVIYILLRVSRDRSGPQLERMSQLMKYDFLIWFAAVILGTSL